MQSRSMCVRQRREVVVFLFFFSSRRRHTRCYRDWSSDVCSSDLLQELAHGEDGDPSVGAELPKVPVSRHEILGAAGHRALEKLVVLRIAPNDGQTPPHADGFRKREQFLLDRRPDLVVAELELGVGQDPQIFLQDFFGNQDRDAAGLPNGDQTRGGPREEQGRDQRVGVEDDPDHLRRLRAQRIARSTSFSVRPRPRIFSRTAFSRSPGALITTGLKTTSPSLRETSKYSASGRCCTIAFGSVIWFLDVFFASMAQTSRCKDTRNSYFPSRGQELSLNASAEGPAYLAGHPRGG